MANSRVMGYYNTTNGSTKMTCKSEPILVPPITEETRSSFSRITRMILSAREQALNEQQTIQTQSATMSPHGPH